MISHRNLALLFTLLILSADLWAEEHASKPNILLMMADDMGMGDTSAYQDMTGNSDGVQIKTPSMEKLARMGIRFTDAHSPSSRCSATRYALLTGRYSWRTRLKYSVLWGPQGDPLIEKDRPTLATLLKQNGYRTGMTGKWHVGLTYRDKDGNPAASYERSDLRKGIADGPLQHGFDFFHGTSRSHPTSAAQGWLSGDQVPAAIAPLKVDRTQYVLTQTGPRNYQTGMKFIKDHLKNSQTKRKPFFLYYACHSNHTSHNPCKKIAGRFVKGKSYPGGKRSDFIYENDVVLGLLLDFLSETEDPRNRKAKLIENTLIIFTSDNGAESRVKTATGPFRSHKGSVYEGGHRVPFIAAWKKGRVGNGNSDSPGITSSFPICHVDLFATFSEILNQPLPEKGAEDSFGLLSAFQNEPPTLRTPLIHHDHAEGAFPEKPARSSKAAWLAIRVDNPVVNQKKIPGKWKLFVDEGLLMQGQANSRELYDLSADAKETRNRMNDPELKDLISHLERQLQEIHDSGSVREFAADHHSGSY